MQTYSGFKQSQEGCWKEYLVLHRKHLKQRVIKVFEPLLSRASGSVRLKAMVPFP